MYTIKGKKAYQNVDIINNTPYTLSALMDEDILMCSKIDKQGKYKVSKTHHTLYTWDYDIIDIMVTQHYNTTTKQVEKIIIDEVY